MNLTKTLMLAAVASAGALLLPSGAQADSFHLSVNSGPSHVWAKPVPVFYGHAPHAKPVHWKKHHRWHGRQAYRAGFRHGMHAAERHDHRHGQRMAYGWR